jgi:hypothetical protein
MGPRAYRENKNLRTQEQPMPNQDSSYYDDAPAAASANGGAGPEGDSRKTAMLNKEVLGGKQVKAGDTITLTVVNDHGNEIEVSCCGEKEQPSESEGAEGQEQGGGEMRSMLED